MWGMKKHYLGHISDANPLELRKVFVGEPCTSCQVLGICGGRCLYANITGRWNAEAYGLVCNTVRNLICAVEEELPRIRKLIKCGRINSNDFDFMKYNGCEIIP
jgi:sulfatase maturation enzyme AslB (radical SAM superfamily)